MLCGNLPPAQGRGCPPLPSSTTGSCAGLALSVGDVLCAHYGIGAICWNPEEFSLTSLAFKQKQFTITKQTKPRHLPSPTPDKKKKMLKQTLKEEIKSSAFSLSLWTIEGHMIQWPIIQHINSCARVITLVVFLPQVKFWNKRMEIMILLININKWTFNFFATIFKMLSILLMLKQPMCLPPGRTMLCALKKKV